ncbi:hypothetical protein J7E87_29230 [Streptomyces sp. ISL-1]|uniref:hypothetical protein n=1 Tax=Streptomyces sp. ISL-1 TaxID=2817657 RepID=UPI001BE5F790|nr:hypothetical protein [Streptomyces sp. ISL-1]MBT2393392.1 hypothetical protein [Streptomyces sp. ISL-1]
MAEVRRLVALGLAVGVFHADVVIAWVKDRRNPDRQGTAVKTALGRWVIDDGGMDTRGPLPHLPSLN